MIQNPRLAVLDLDTGDQRILPLNGSHPRYLSSGHFVYSSIENTVWAVGFDADQLEVVSDSIPVLEGVPLLRDGGAKRRRQRRRGLVYRPGSQSNSRTLVWVDRNGREEPLGMPPRAYDWPRVSPDGQRVVVDTGAIGGDLFLHNVGTRVDQQFTFDPAVDQYPLWSKDSSTILFSSTRAEGPGGL